MQRSPSALHRFLFIAVTIVAVGCLYAAPLFAADPGATCAASKRKAAAKQLSAKVKCYGTALKKGKEVDASCLSTAESKFNNAFAKAEGKGGCATMSDAGDIESLVDDTLAQLLAALPATAPAVEICNNGEDDDENGLIDCNDPACEASAECGVVEICSNGTDDDANGFIDCEDPACVGSPACPAAELCSNGIDDDGDGFVDCEDPDCDAGPACAP